MWKNLGEVAPRELTEPRLQLHHALQLPAIGVGRSLLPQRPDDSNSSLEWDPAAQHWLADEIPGSPFVRFGLRAADLSLRWIAGGEHSGEMSLIGRTIADGRKWLVAELDSLGMDIARVSFEAHYAIPGHAVAEGRPFDDLYPAFLELSRYFDNMHGLLEELAAREDGVTPVRTWPHHFDLAALVQLDPPDTEPARTVGIGMSPGDENYGEPYFYVSPYPLPSGAGLPDLPVGHWHTEGFVSAILPASLLVEAPDQRARAHEFLEHAIARSRDLLGVNTSA